MARCILVVDDEPDLLELVRFNLDRAGFRVETAASGEEALDRLRRSTPDLLVLDDFGLKALHPPGPEDLYDIINERYERGSIMLTSNRAPSEWPDMFGNPLLASAALDRLAHRAAVLVITGGSYRAQGRRRLEEEVHIEPSVSS